MEQEIDTRPIGPPSHKQRKEWMHLSSESESDGKLRREPSSVKLYEREKKIQRLRSLDLHLPGELHEQGQSLSDEELSEIDKRTPHRWKYQTRKIGMVKGAIEARDPYETPAVEKARKRLLKEFAGSVFQTRVGGDHKIRGPHGEAEIKLKSDAVPVKQRMFQIQGER